MNSRPKIPPSEIDGARILEWAWSGQEPFGVVFDADSVFGLAIATYDGVVFYRFSCGQDWNTIQDADYESITAAKEQLPDQYRSAAINWVTV